MTEEELAQRAAMPLPQSGNLVGALQNLKKAEIELSGQTPLEIAAINERFNSIQTRGNAQAYAALVMKNVGIAREQRKLATHRKP